MGNSQSNRFSWLPYSSHLSHKISFETFKRLSHTTFRMATEEESFNDEEEVWQRILGLCPGSFLLYRDQNLTNESEQTRFKWRVVKIQYKKIINNKPCIKVNFGSSHCKPDIWIHLEDSTLLAPLNLLPEHQIESGGALDDSQAEATKNYLVTGLYRHGCKKHELKTCLRNEMKKMRKASFSHLKQMSFARRVKVSCDSYKSGSFKRKSLSCIKEGSSYSLDDYVNAMNEYVNEGKYKDVSERSNERFGL